MALENKYPTRTQEHKLVPDPDPHLREMPVPATGIFDNGDLCFPAINHEWMAYIVGRLHDLADEQRWAGSDSEKWHARQQIEELLSADLTCLTCPDPVIWAKTFDFNINNGGFTTVAASNGSHVVNSGGWIGSVVGSTNTLHIKRTFTAANVHGMSILATLAGTGTKEARLSVLNPSEQFIYSNLNQPAITNGEISATSPRENVTEIRVRLASSGSSMSVLLRRLTIWGEGSNPF